LGKPISFALNQWVGLQVYLEDGQVEIDPAERNHSAHGGKKHLLFIGAAEAGWRSAVLYTMIENCRLEGINAFEYLRDVLTRLPTMASNTTSNRNVPGFADGPRGATVPTHAPPAQIRSDRRRKR
jgi:hypothetical protein